MYVLDKVLARTSNSFLSRTIVIVSVGVYGQFLHQQYQNTAGDVFLLDTGSLQ